SGDAESVRFVFSQLDDRSLSVEQQLRNYTRDAVILAPDQAAIRGAEDLRAHLSASGRGVAIQTRHEIVELKSLAELVVVEGKVTGTAQPDGDPNIYAFETKNIIIFKRTGEGALKIWKVIYNAAPVAESGDQAARISIEQPLASNPFQRFLGVWTLKDDAFQQVWDGETVETLRIPDHVTTCAPVNTEKSVMCVVDVVGNPGHIFWAYDDRADAFRHLSHFGAARLGHGDGAILENGDLRITVSFSDEPAGTYRKYEYNWVSDDEYAMMSRQFTADGAPTGNWYGGSFVRQTGNR
ncbi:MAG: hypothetical protein AAGJ87_15305, partial [Pseudomonadota bacterium]